MTLPAQQTDVWSLASQQDQIKALVLLASLPARETGDAQVDKAAYYIALDGVTRFGLAEAVKAVLQGRLGHAFFPSAAELRIQCDKAMEHHVSMRRQIERQEQIRRERPAERPPLTEAEKERHAARMKAFNAGYETEKVAQPRIYLDPELVAKIPDAKTTWVNAGKAA